MPGFHRDLWGLKNSKESKLTKIALNTISMCPCCVRAALLSGACFGSLMLFLVCGCRAWLCVFLFSACFHPALHNVAVCVLPWPCARCYVPVCYLQIAQNNTFFWNTAFQKYIPASLLVAVNLLLIFGLLFCSPCLPPINLTVTQHWN